MLERYRYTIALAGLVLLLLPRLPGIGQQVNGAYLGVKIGPLAFQPAEFAKIAIVIFLATYLRDTRRCSSGLAPRSSASTLPPLKHFGPLLVVWGAAMLMLVFIRDLGSSLMYFGAFLALLYVATDRLSFVVIGLALFVRRRLVLRHARAATSTTASTIWLDPFNPALIDKVSGYQIVQSHVRPGRRRAVRQGLRRVAAHCRAARPLIPAPQTDMIYAVIVNELGLFGACGLILVYLLIAERGFKTAMLAERLASRSCWPRA